MLGGVLSALDGVRPEHLNLASLVERVARPEVTEVILALNATVDGQTTAHYVTESIRHCDVKVTRLAHGVPVGGELDYLDEGPCRRRSAAARPSDGRSRGSSRYLTGLRPHPIRR